MHWSTHQRQAVIKVGGNCDYINPNGLLRYEMDSVLGTTNNCIAWGSSLLYRSILCFLCARNAIRFLLEVFGCINVLREIK